MLLGRRIKCLVYWRGISWTYGCKQLSGNLMRYIWWYKGDSQQHAIVVLALNVTTELPPKWLPKFANLIEVYSTVFSSGPFDCGKSDIVKYSIETGDCIPIKKLFKDLVRDMSVRGVIRLSASPWSSHVVLVKKKNGSSRFCGEYSRWNEVTRKDSTPKGRITFQFIQVVLVFHNGFAE